MKQAVIDTNIYIHAIVEESSLNVKAKETLDKIETWLTPIIVVYELVWVFRKLGLGVKDIHSILYVVTTFEQPCG